LYKMVRERERMTRLTSRHDNRRSYHQFPVVASENAEEPEHDDSTSKDAKTDGETTNADTSGVMTIDVEGLCWPEHDDREKVGAGDEGDDQSQGQDARFPLKTSWEHGEFGTLDFPDDEGDAESSSEEEGDEDVGRCPFILFRELVELGGARRLLGQPERT
jgi:hypothetical protein